MKKNLVKMMMIGAVATLATTSCSRDDDNSTTGKSMKYTITLNGVENSDFVSIAIAGATSNTNDTTVWKINGATQNAQQGIGLGDTDFWERPKLMS